MFRIAPMTPLYRRGSDKGAPPDGQRKPRRRCRVHLERVAQLPCAVPGCGVRPVHVAHVRYASAVDGAEHVGKAMKPDDWRCLPLCPAHHTEGRRAQHRTNEMLFWAQHDINPYALARALWNLSGDMDVMELVIERAPLLFPSRPCD